MNATVLEVDVRIKTATEDGRRCMAAQRQEEKDASRHRQEKREATRLGRLSPYTEA